MWYSWAGNEIPDVDVFLFFADKGLYFTAHEWLRVFSAAFGMRTLVHDRNESGRPPRTEVGLVGASRDRPFFSIVIPVLNEENYIEQCVASLLKQTPKESGEILIVDGGSTDRTKRIVKELQSVAPNILLLDNPRRYQSSAVNLAAEAASPKSNILIRADAHAEYPEDFVVQIIRAFEATNASSVVVPMYAVGRGGFQNAVAAVQNSILGTGGAPHRVETASRYVDHGHHAGFDRAVFQRLGGYNSSFSHNEDAEYDYRLSKSGGRIWLCCEATITYFPRSNLSGLILQYFRFGKGRMRTILLHGGGVRLRQLLPVILLLINIFSLAGSLVFPILLVFPAAYLSLCVIWSAILAVRDGDWCVLGGCAAAIAMHLAWAVGAFDTLARRFWLKGFWQT